MSDKPGCRINCLALVFLYAAILGTILLAIPIILLEMGVL